MPKRIKTLSASLVAVSMAATFVACGPIDEQSGISSKPAFTSVSDAMAACLDYTTGEYTADMKYSNSRNTSAAFRMTGKMDGDSFTVDSVNVSSGDVSYGLNNAVVVTGGDLYINVDGVMTLLGVGTDLGYYGIPLPDASIKPDVKKRIVDLEKNMVTEVFSDCDVKIDGRTLSVTVDTKDEFKSVSSHLVDFISDHRDDIAAIGNDVIDGVDIQAYLNKLVDNIYPDLKEAYAVQSDGDMSAFPERSDVDDTIGSVTSDLDFSSDYMFEMIDDLKEEIDGYTDEDWDEAFASYEGSSCGVFLSAEDDTCTVKFTVHSTTALDLSFYADESSDDTSEVYTEDVEVTFTVVKSDVKITAPEKITTLTAISTFCKENPDALDAISEKLSGIFGYASPIQSYPYNDIDYAE